MTVDFRALCADLLRELEHASAWDYQQALKDQARAALAQPRPEVGPTDEELDAWITECADATRYGPLEHYWAFDVQFDHVRDITRAVLARWGNHSADASKMVGQPAPPAEGEVAELVALIRQISLAWEPEACLLGKLEQRHPAPVPVSERLPRPEDCDAEGRCWWWYPPVPEQNYGYWIYEDNAVPERSKLEWPDSWLPFHALPLPSREVEHG